MALADVLSFSAGKYGAVAAKMAARRRPVAGLFEDLRGRSDGAYDGSPLLMLPVELSFWQRVSTLGLEADEPKSTSAGASTITYEPGGGHLPA